MQPEDESSALFREEQLAALQGVSDDHASESMNGPDAPDAEQIRKWRPHAHHSIGNYRSYSNHSSAGDQPSTSTGW